MNQKADGFFNIKYIGYCLSQLPPEEVKSSFEDFVNYAKFQLCIDRNVLFHDPVWDRYNEEQILVEYYASVFSKDKEQRGRFEAQLQGEYTDIYDWFDKKIEENRKEMEATLGGTEDKLSFSPEQLGE